MTPDTRGTNRVSSGEIPLCMSCGGLGDRWETLDQNGGWEWWTYCADCDVETFSETFPYYSLELNDG